MVGLIHYSSNNCDVTRQQSTFVAFRRWGRKERIIQQEKEEKKTAY
jgi:hypothetical protein